MIGPLAILAGRRVAPRSTWVILGAAALALAWRDSDATNLALDAQVLDAFRRRETWATLGALIAMLVVYRAAALSLDWRRRDADAFAGAPRSRFDVALTTWVGAWSASLVLILALTALIEARTSASAPWDRELGQAAVVSSNGVDDAQRLHATVSAPRGARWLELDLGFLATDVSATLELTARRGGETCRASQRVSSRARLRVAAPGGAGAIELELRRTQGSGLVFLATDAVTFLGAEHAPFWASLVLALHVALGAAVWIALAFALGAFLPPALAGSSALALSVPSWLGEHPAWARWTPWGALPDAFEAVGRGTIPALPGVTIVASSAIVIALSLALATRGLRSWRVTR